METEKGAAPTGNEGASADGDWMSELRVRANSVIGVLDFLLLSELSPNQKKYVELARASGGEILQLLAAASPVKPDVQQTDMDAHVLDPGVRRKPRLVALFFEHLPTYLDILEQAIEERDALKVERQAHKIKGSCLAFGTPGMSELCVKIETAGRNGQLESTTEDFNQLRTEFGKVRNLMNTQREKYSETDC